MDGSIERGGALCIVRQTDGTKLPLQFVHDGSDAVPVVLLGIGANVVEQRSPVRHGLRKHHLDFPEPDAVLLAHEVVHNWWGNAVAVDYANGNWAEGLTTYMADYGLERDKGELAARNMRIMWLRDYAALPAALDRPVRDFRSKQHQADQVIGYNKVAFVFHMLCQEIGQQAFDEGIRNFWRGHRFDTASWQDLQQAFEQSAGVRLDWFFRQWLDQAGAPLLSLGTHQVKAVEDGYRTRIEILQSASVYQFTFAVELVTETGVEQRQLRVEDRLTRLEWVTAGRPRSIILIRKATFSGACKPAKPHRYCAISP